MCILSLKDHTFICLITNKSNSPNEYYCIQSLYFLDNYQDEKETFVCWFVNKLSIKRILYITGAEC